MERKARGIVRARCFLYIYIYIYIEPPTFIDRSLTHDANYCQDFVAITDVPNAPRRADLLQTGFSASFAEFGVDVLKCLVAGKVHQKFRPMSTMNRFFLPMLAKETQEMFDINKVGEFTRNKTPRTSCNQGKNSAKIKPGQDNEPMRCNSVEH